MKRILRLTMAALLLGSFGANAQYQFSGGKGTSDDPFQIKTAEDLNHVRDFLMNSEVNFKVMNDIDLTEFLGEGDWTPIGSGVDSGFEGTFDGGNYTISGLFIGSGNDGLGLFGRLNAPAVLKNVKIDGASISGNDWCGILVSTNGNYQKDGGTIENCHVTNSFLDGNSCLGAIAGVNEGNIINSSGFNNNIDAKSNNIGGLVGMSESGTRGHSRIIDCFSMAIVNGNESVAGVVGLYRSIPSAEGEYSIQNCATYGTVTGNLFCGGIAGWPDNGESRFDNLCSAADVTGGRTGGLFGAPLNGNLSNSYSTGNIVGTKNPKDKNYDWTGGIVGEHYGSLIEDVYFSGTISGEAMQLGAIGGRNSGQSVLSSYYNKDGAKFPMGEGGADKYKITALSLDEMKSLANMKFSKPEKWQIKEGVTTPYFVNQTAPLVIEECNERGASGTYEGNVSELYFYTDGNGAVNYVSSKIEGGKWSVVWDEYAVAEDNVVVAFCKEDGKMPSLTTSAIVKAGSVAEVETAGDVKVVAGKGFLRIISDTAASYQVFNVAGAALMQGNVVAGESEISTGSLSSGIYVVMVKTENGLVSRKVVL